MYHHLYAGQCRSTMEVTLNESCPAVLLSFHLDRIDLCVDSVLKEHWYQQPHLYVKQIIYSFKLTLRPVIF